MLLRIVAHLNVKALTKKEQKTIKGGSSDGIIEADVTIT